MCKRWDGVTWGGVRWNVGIRQNSRSGGGYGRFSNGLGGDNPPLVGVLVWVVVWP